MVDGWGAVVRSRASGRYRARTRRFASIAEVSTLPSSSTSTSSRWRWGITRSGRGDSGARMTRSASLRRAASGSALPDVSVASSEPSPRACDRLLVLGLLRQRSALQLACTLAQLPLGGASRLPLSVQRSSCRGRRVCVVASGLVPSRGRLRATIWAACAPGVGSAWLLRPSRLDLSERAPAIAVGLVFQATRRPAGPALSASSRSRRSSAYIWAVRASSSGLRTRNNCRPAGGRTAQRQLGCGVRSNFVSGCRRGRSRWHRPVDGRTSTRSGLRDRLYPCTTAVPSSSSASSEASCMAVLGLLGDWGCCGEHRGASPTSSAAVVPSGVDEALDLDGSGEPEEDRTWSGMNTGLQSGCGGRVGRRR